LAARAEEAQTMRIGSGQELIKDHGEHVHAHREQGQIAGERRARAVNE
jgi:hypothetical protein